MRRTLAAAVLTMATALAAVLVSGPEAAWGQAPPALGIREIDATDPNAVAVTFTYAGDRADLAGLSIREGGDLVDATSAVPASQHQGLGLALVIDSSGSMETSGLVGPVLDAARAFIDDKAPTDQVAVLAFDRDVRVLQDFTIDGDALKESLDEFPLARETSLFDAIVRAAALFDDTNLLPNIVVFSDGGDTDSVADAGRAQAAVENVGGSLYALGVDNPDFDALRGIAAATGGTAAVTADVTGVRAIFESVQGTIAKQYVVTFRARSRDGSVPVTLAVGAARATADLSLGSVRGGVELAAPQPAADAGGPAFLRTPTGLMVSLGLVVAAAAAAAFTLGTTFFGRDRSLQDALLPYSESYLPTAAAGQLDPRSDQLAQTTFVQRAVDVTEDLARRQGLLSKVERLLERANLSLRPAEAIFFYVAAVLVVLLLLLALGRPPIAALLGAGFAALIPPATLSFLANRRRKRFEALLPDTLQLLASTLRAGFSLMQGVEAVSNEVTEPMGRELRRVVTEARLGRPLEESLDGIAERMESPDFAWAVMAIGIQREVGGNLSELLVTVADTMTERERLRREVAGLTAEGKISAIVLGIMPPAIGTVIYVMNPEYMTPLFETTIGHGLIAGSVLLASFGFWWMKKTIEIDI